MARYAALVVLMAGCTGNEAKEKWRYERVLWENERGVESADDVRARTDEVAAKGGLTLEECWKLAVRRSETLALTGEELVRLETTYDQAIGSILPRVSFKGSATRQDDRGVAEGVFTLSKRTEYKFTIKQPIFQGLREFYAIRQASHLREAKEHELRHARLLLFADVAEAFLAVVQARKDLSTTEDTLRVATERLEELRQRNKLGMARRTEVLAQEAEAASTQAQVEELKGRLEVAWEILEFLTGLDRRPALADTVADPGELPPARALVDRAVKERADLRSLDGELAAADQAVRIAQAGYLPTVTLDANYYTHRAGVSSEVDWDVILSLEVPMFDGLTTYAKIREAESSLRSVQLRRDRLVRDISLQIQREYAEVLSLRSEIVSLEKAVASAEESHDLLVAEQRQQIATNFDVLQGFNTLQRTRLERDRARAQLKLAGIRLAVQGGTLPGGGK